jgi:hypothetical protein
MGAVDEIKPSVVSAFLDRCSPGLGDLVKVYAAPTEEIQDAAARRKPIALHARGGAMLSAGGGARARLEENYLFDTRRFPSFVTGEAFPVALLPGEYLFFGSAVGQPSANNGFNPAVVAVMSDVETNMDVASQIPQGKDYVLTQIGVSFNSDISTADLALLLEMGAIRFEKQGGQFTLKHGGPKMWPSGMGISGYSTATTVTAAHNGIADIRAVRRLAVPRVLRQKETFAYKYVVPRASRNTLGVAAAATLSAGTIMSIWLWGGQQDAIPV